MSESSEAAEQMVRMMLSGGEAAIRLSGSAIKNSAALLLALARSHKRVFGKVRLVQMLRETRDIRQFQMTPGQFRTFKKMAKKKKVLYSAIRDRLHPSAQTTGAAAFGKAGGTSAKKRRSVEARLTRYKGQLLYLQRQGEEDDE